jgi:UDP-N-acetylglucosamine--N-acetylmuramyl-(pentapeptide) pyrophosphoryl-undecaprenol N-acetylglucosamine transferase
VPALYIESVSRTHGPSLTGRVIAAINAAETRTQHREWASEKWGVHDSVLGTYRAVPKRPAKRPRLFVTLGTIEGYRFDALVDAIVATGLADEFTVWQLGETERVDLPGRVTTQISAQEFETAAREADVVVSHAGVGSLLNLLDWGIRPVLVPRRSSRREHVDDHQEQIAELARERDVAEVVEVGDLTAANLWAASGRRIEAAIR